jgi:hypothetical protein
MRTPQAIIQELKHQLNWSQPNIRFTEMSNLINELEAALSPSTSTKKPEPVVEEVVAVETVEENVEEVVETKVVKKTTKK